MGLGSEAQASTKQSLFGDIITFHVESKEEEKVVSVWHPCGS